MTHRTAQQLQQESIYLPMIAHAFNAASLDATLAVAMARHESQFDPKARNFEGPDGARGGSYGLFQMSVMTARELSFHDDPADLWNPEINIAWTIKLMADNKAHIMRSGLVPTPTLLAAAHNAGITRVVTKRIPQRVLDTYVQPILSYYLEYHGRVSAVLDHIGADHE